MDLQKLDPDWQKAKQHGQASRPGIPIQIGTSDTIVVCGCCHEQIYKDKLPVCQNSKQLEFIGIGFPLFYEFLKNCIKLTFFTTCSYHALSLFLAVQNNWELCNSPSSNSHSDSHRLLVGGQQCYTFMVEISRIESSVSTLEQALRIVSFVLHGVLLLYIRNRIIKLEAYYNERTPTLGDYSVIIKGMTKMKGIQGRIRHFFDTQFDQSHRVRQLTLLPEYPEITLLQSMKTEKINKMRHFYKNDNFVESNEFLELQKEIDHIEQQIIQASQLYKQKANADQLQCEKAICVFETEMERIKIINQFNEISDQIKIKYFGQCSKVTLQRAPEPEEMIWQNTNITARKRFFHIVFGWILSILVLVVVFVIFFFILQQKALNLSKALSLIQQDPDNEKYLTKKRGAIGLVYFTIFLVVLFNKLFLSTIYHKFTDWQKHNTTSNYQFSFAVKLCLGLFFTTAIMTLSVEVIRFGNYYSHPYGLIDEQTIFFFLNSYFVPLFWLVNPLRIAKLIKRKFYEGKRSLTQLEANHLMEDQHYDVGKRFAQIIETMWFTYFYSTLLPIGAVMTCSGLLIYYWVDKYNLLRRSSVSGHLSGEIINTSLTMLDLTLVLRPIGSLIFDSHLRQNTHSSTIMMVIACVFVLVPKNKLIELVNHENFRPQEKTFSELKYFFRHTYHDLHPIYRLIHKQKVELKLKKKGIVINNNSPSETSNLIMQVSSPIKKRSENIQIIQM